MFTQSLAERLSDLLAAVDDIDIGALAQEYCEGFASKLGPDDWYNHYTGTQEYPNQVRWDEGATSTGAPGCTDRQRNDFLISVGPCNARSLLFACWQRHLTSIRAEDELKWQVGIDVARSVVDKVAEALAN